MSTPAVLSPLRIQQFLTNFEHFLANHCCCPQSRIPHCPSLNPQPVCRTGRKPGTTGRLFEGQQDPPRSSGGGTTQRSESAGWASPPGQPLGRVPGWEGGGWARRSACGAVCCCYWSCLEWLRQWAPGPSAESTRTTAGPPGWAASARTAPRWTLGRPSWVPFPCVRSAIRVLDTSHIRDQSRRGVGKQQQRRLFTWMGSGSCLLSGATAGSFPFVLGLDLTILAGLGLLDSLSGSS